MGQQKRTADQKIRRRWEIVLFGEELLVAFAYSAQGMLAPAFFRSSYLLFRPLNHSQGKKSNVMLSRFVVQLPASWLHLFPFQWNIPLPVTILSLLFFHIALKHMKAHMVSVTPDQMKTIILQEKVSFWQLSIKPYFQSECLVQR